MIRAITQQITAVLGTLTPLLQPSRDRIAVTIGAPNNVVNVGFGGVIPTAAAGISMGVDSPPLLLTVETHGDIVTREFQAYAPFAGVTITVIELIDDGCDATVETLDRGIDVTTRQSRPAQPPAV